MRIAGLLAPGTTLNYITEGKFIRGSLIVVDTLEQRDDLVKNSKVLRNGAPIYVSSEKATFRYNSEANSFSKEPILEENEDGILCVKRPDGSLEKIKFNISVDDLSDELKQKIENSADIQSVAKLLSDTLSNYATLDSLDILTSKIDTKQDKLKAGKGVTISEDNTISFSGSGGSGDWDSISNKPFSKINENDFKVVNDELQAVVCTVIEGSGDVITGAEVNAAGELVLTKGNLLDSNVLISDDFTFTAPVGTVTIPSSGSTIVSAKNKTLKEFLSGLFAAAKDPTVTQPSVSIKLNQAGAYEVGSEVTPTYSVTFNAGSYQYGPATGVTAKYSVTDGVTGHEAQTGATGSFAKLTVGDSTSYGVSVTATHTAGASAKNNLGALVGSKINAGTKTASSSKVTGYRNSFYGGVKSKEGTPTNAVIRALSDKSGKTNTAGNTFDAQEKVGDLRVIIAVPAPRTCTSIKDVNGLNAEALSAFTHVTVNVEGANAYEAKSYNVYYKDNATACDKANKWHVTLG